MDAKVIEIRREQDARYADVNSKLDRNAANVVYLTEKMETEFRAVRQSLADAKDAFAASKGAEEFKRWLVPIAISVLVVIIEAANLIKR